MGEFSKLASLSLYVPNIVRHPYKKDPKRDPNLDNYPFICLFIGVGGILCTKGFRKELRDWGVGFIGLRTEAIYTSGF